MAHTFDVPAFGPLSGVKVLDTGQIIAGPFAGCLMAESGATVIHVDSVRAPDGTRGTYGWSQEHRNQLNMALDIPSEEGRKVFLRLIKWADIWIESSKGGTYEKWGLTDELLWEYNPRLAIVHTSGYGQTGLPEYVKQGSYDAAGQAFSGYMSLNGMPDTPMKVNPYICDYVTALNTCWCAMACYISSLRSGKGESADVAQYETMVKIMNTKPADWLNDRKVTPRTGNADNLAAAFSFYTCKDGVPIFIGMSGAGPAKAGYPIVGLPEPGTGDPDFPAGMGGDVIWSERGQRIDKAVADYCAAHDSQEVEAVMKEKKIPCQRVYTLEDCENDPHFQAREVFTEWEDPIFGKLKGIGLINKFKVNPAQIWRGAPLFGNDNDDILGELGFSEDEIKALYDGGTIKQWDRDESIRYLGLDQKFGLEPSQ
ncbi:CoA transferase [Eggerthella timonensis]|uniref:CoA transferase n=1 Tax=Eggerthella timonensis TaxID=1871008 RepID=UPI000C78E5BC|nr:CoA transferase [Eggerthella timonensis]